MTEGERGAVAPPGIIICRHPGTPLAQRMTFVAVEVRAPFRLHVEAGADLYRTLHAALDARDAGACAFTLVSGTVGDLTIMTGGGGTEERPMSFRGPHPMPGPLAVVAGAGSTGIGLDGGRLTHCHAAFRSADGRLRGGHLILGKTIAGPDGLLLDVTVLESGRFAVRADPETLFDIFHPEAG